MKPTASRIAARGLMTGLCLLAWLAPVRAPAQPVEGRCAVQFFATTTLHDFEGSAPCALLAIDPPDAGGVYRAHAEVAVAQMETGIGARDKKMREMFEAQRFPRIVASFEPIDPAALRALRAGALSFRLAIHGVERSVTPSLSDWSEVAGKSAHFRATFDVSLRDFGLEAPVAMGFIRVDDTVKVVVDVDLAAPAAAAPPAATR